MRRVRSSGEVIPCGVPLFVGIGMERTRRAEKKRLRWSLFPPRGAAPTRRAVRSTSGGQGMRRVRSSGEVIPCGVPLFIGIGMERTRRAEKKRLRWSLFPPRGAAPTRRAVRSTSGGQGMRRVRSSGEVIPCGVPFAVGIGMERTRRAEKKRLRWSVFPPPGSSPNVTRGAEHKRRAGDAESPVIG